MKNIFKNILKIKYILPLVVLIVCVAFAVNNFANGTFSADSINKRETFNIENSTTNTTTTNSTNSTGNSEVETSPLPSESNSNSSTSNVKVKSVLPLTLSSNQKYKDGTYYGTGVGFNGNLTVRVTIKNGKIANIEIVKTGDGDQYIAKAKELFKTIYAQQNTNVDTVSGATYSSNGLIEAVSNALSKAIVNKDNSNSNSNNNTTHNNNKVTTTTTPRKAPTKPSVPNMTDATFKDGTYIGVGEGYKGDIKVSVVIKNGKISKINILSTEDDEQFFSKARTLTSTIISRQTADVDTVSGATFSSNGIIEAVSNALQKAYVKQTTTVPTTTVTTTNNTTSTTLPSEPSVNFKYENGTYMAQVVCYPDDGFDFEEYTLSLKITIFNDTITSIDEVMGVGDNYDTSNDWYMNRAIRGTTKYPSVVKQILNKNTTADVDTVSGATCSSKAIIEAVNKALLIAEVKGD